MECNIPYEKSIKLKTHRYSCKNNIEAYKKAIELNKRFVDIIVRIDGLELITCREEIYGRENTY